MVERSWDYYKKQEVEATEKRWKAISRELILQFGISCDDALCYSNPENEFKKDVGVEMEKLNENEFFYIRVECKVCNGYFRPERLPEEFVSFARYYFFGENPNTQDEVSKEIPVGSQNKFQLPLPT